MWYIAPPFLVFCLLLASTGVGLFFNSRLKERHRALDSIELINSTITLQVTFTAVVLGLLTSSVKTSFEAAYTERATYAGELAQLDRCLRNYGLETTPAREQLRAYVAAVIASTWPDEKPPAGLVYPDPRSMPRTGEDPTLAKLINDVGFSVRSLEPTDTLHRAIASACISDFTDVQKARWAIIEGLHGAVSTPFYMVLMIWLAIMFGCFGLRAPPNRLNFIIIALCSISVSMAVFVIQSLDFPYGGLFGVPSDTMRNALKDMMGS